MYRCLAHCSATEPYDGWPYSKERNSPPGSSTRPTKLIDGNFPTVGSCPKSHSYADVDNSVRGPRKDEKKYNIGIEMAHGKIS